ncbi:uncharacterized protein BDZ99DRAFT_551394 [Mytilinidion resinicola]|uniref:Uncharacterized protein n=1 Tax=Mytilinidion resinicola TaxID=574789 RepID=A0A6A6Y416_9PEZI|nr:uncharacterized protein BDZ99DRAFT_551394 [Mytilinidion resinicola]KAF2802527.1 hypothetical protein BDZ99DRAFT_551394 [Mytilinidion resinicola]
MSFPEDPAPGKPFTLEDHIIDILVKIDGHPAMELSATTVSHGCEHCGQIWGGNLGNGYEGGMASLHFGSPPGHVEYPDSQAPKFLGLFVESEVNQGLRMTFEKREHPCKRCGEDLERKAPHSSLGTISIQTKNIGSAMTPTAQSPFRKRDVRKSPPPCEKDCLITMTKDLEEIEIEMNKHKKNVRYYEAKLERLPEGQRGPESAVWFYLSKARDDSKKWLEDNEGVVKGLHDKLIALRHGEFEEY